MFGNIYTIFLNAVEVKYDDFPFFNVCINVIFARMTYDRFTRFSGTHGVERLKTAPGDYILREAVRSFPAFYTESLSPPLCFAPKH